MDSCGCAPRAVIVKASSGPRYVVGCRSKVDKSKLISGTRVALDMTTLTVMRFLPREVPARTRVAPSSVTTAQCWQHRSSIIVMGMVTAPHLLSACHACRACGVVSNMHVTRAWRPVHQVDVASTAVLEHALVG